MALHPDFPKNPHQILDPKLRWFPAEETLREQRYDHLMPPLVDNLRKKVKAWRDDMYQTETNVWVIETKGNADMDVPLKLERLKQWCEDMDKVQDKINYDCLYVE